MKVQEKVLVVWQSLSYYERRMVRNRAKSCVEAGLRNRCKVVLNLVAGNGARAIAKLGLCSISQVYHVAKRSVEYGPPGLADQREDNGKMKTIAVMESRLTRPDFPSQIMSGWRVT